MKKLLKNLSSLQDKNSAFAPLPTEQMKNVFGGNTANDSGFETLGSDTRGQSCCYTGSGDSTRRCFVSCCVPELY